MSASSRFLETDSNRLSQICLHLTGLALNFKLDLTASLYDRITNFQKRRKRLFVMYPQVRKVVVVQEEVLIEGGRPVPTPFTLVAAAAVISNPWHGFVDDLQPGIQACAPVLADILVSQAVPLLGGASRIETFGKCAVVGTGGEVEHAAALIHTLHFGNRIRDAAAGTSFMPFTNTRGAPGSVLTVPLKHKLKEFEGSRGHFLTMQLAVPDAPGSDEIIVAVAFGTGERPHHRIGDRYRDAREMDLALAQ